VPVPARTTVAASIETRFTLEEKKHAQCWRSPAPKVTQGESVKATLDPVSCADPPSWVELEEAKEAKETWPPTDPPLGPPQGKTGPEVQSSPAASHISNTKTFLSRAAEGILLEKQRIVLFFAIITSFFGYSLIRRLFLGTLSGPKSVRGCSPIPTE
jgi:hypothetical protein